MKYRRLGKHGLEVSELSLGSWVTFGNQIDDRLAKELMVKAYDSGVNFFDNAEAYAMGQSEIVMGENLKQLGWPRDSFVVSSKVFWGGEGPNRKGLNRKHVMDACHNALRRLQVEYLDLFFCHRPDAHTPIEETVWAMNTLIQQGKVLYWGTSEWSAQQIMEAHAFARQNCLIPPAMEQPEYHMFHRERFEAEYADLYTHIGLGTTTWSPLNSGILTGKYLKGIPRGSRLSLESLGWLKDKLLEGITEEKIHKLRELMILAEELELTMATLAIAWVLKNPNVSTVILGATKMEQLEENLKAASAVELLTEEVLQRIEDILQNKPVSIEW
ncbi:MAG: aldo/keto reductase [FCB group bacterium]|nr:aldo/keto reductase [FCB group bacterium]